MKTHLHYIEIWWWNYLISNSIHKNLFIFSQLVNFRSLSVYFFVFLQFQNIFQHNIERQKFFNHHNLAITVTCAYFLSFQCSTYWYANSPLILKHLSKFVIIHFLSIRTLSQCHELNTCVWADWMMFVKDFNSCIAL